MIFLYPMIEKSVQAKSLKMTSMFLKEEKILSPKLSMNSSGSRGSSNNCEESKKVIIF